MRTKIIIILFTVTVVVQLWVPVTMIFSSEKTLNSGISFKFRTAPVDPYDAFRGKYVTLEFDASLVDSTVYAAFLRNNNMKLSNGHRVYATIVVDSIGFAKIGGLQVNKPKVGSYVNTIIDGFPRSTMRVRFPFTKFFLEEGKAKKAEQLYRKYNRPGMQDSYAVVKISIKGHAVIEDLIIGGTSVKEAVR